MEDHEYRIKQLKERLAAAQSNLTHQGRTIHEGRNARVAIPLRVFQAAIREIHLVGKELDALKTQIEEFIEEETGEEE